MMTKILNRTPDPNDSVLVFKFITKWLPVEDFIEFNIRDICELELGEWGFCKRCTTDKGILIAACLYILGRLANFMGAPIRLYNIGGNSLAVLYDNIDTSLFESVTPHRVHLSLLI